MSDSLQFCSNLMTAVIMIAMVTDMDNMVKAIIGPEMEKRLGRRLTESDWQVYRQEKADREQRAAWNSFMTRWQRRLIDRQIIRDFVWEEE